MGAVKYQSPDVVDALLRQHPQTLVQSPLALTRQHVNQEQRSISFVFSTEGTKRDGHNVRAAGWELENFKRAGAPILWSHNAKVDLPPVGIAPNIRVEGKQLVGDVIFSQEEFSQKLFRLYASDPPFMRAASVNWMPLEWQPNVDEHGRIVGNLYTRQDLLETSLVAVGADPGALSRAIQSGILTGDDIEHFVLRAGIVPTPYLVRINDATDTAAETSPDSETETPSASPSVVVSSSPSLARSATPAMPTSPETRSGPPATARSSTPRRGEIADAMAADDEANLLDMLDACGRAFYTMVDLVGKMAPGVEENSARISSLLSEFSMLLQPVLTKIANNPAKENMGFRMQQRLLALFPGEVRGQVITANTPDIPVVPVPVPTPVARPPVSDRVTALQVADQQEQLRARVNKLTQNVTLSSDAPEEESPKPTQQQLYFDRTPVVHASIAATIRDRLDKLRV